MQPNKKKTKTRRKAGRSPALDVAICSASWVKPTSKTVETGYYWCWDGDLAHHAVVVRVTKPLFAYVAMGFGYFDEEWTMLGLEKWGNMLLRLEAPRAPWPNVKAQPRGQNNQ